MARPRKSVLNKKSKLNITNLVESINKEMQGGSTIINLTPEIPAHLMPANSVQVGGDHYASSIQHWDYVVANDMDYFQAQITRYVTRWKKKNGIQDLEKALHYMQKYLEVVKSGKYLPADKVVVPVAKKGRPKKA